MGGIISITIRRSNGEVFNMKRHTNFLPFLFSEIKFWNEDEDYILQYINNWKKDKVEYENLKDKDLPAQSTMYSPYDNKNYPIDYGIIVVDFLNKKILSSQNYFTPNKISMIELHYDIKGIHLYKDGEKEFTERIEELINNKVIRKMLFKEREIIHIEKLEWKKIINIAKGSIFPRKNDDYLFYDFILEPDNWEFKNFDNSKDEVIELKNELIKLNFDLEENKWNYYLKNKFE